MKLHRHTNAREPGVGFRPVALRSTCSGSPSNYFLGISEHNIRGGFAPDTCASRYNAKFPLTYTNFLHAQKSIELLAEGFIYICLLQH